MRIREATPDDHERLFNIWLKSVRATHTFLSDGDIQLLARLVRDHALKGLELWVLESPPGVLIGFLGLSGKKLDALFMEPEFLRRGGGRLLVSHAQQIKGKLSVDVNEQNPAARAFYEAMGFVVIGRSELDDAGRPFPLLRMQQPGFEQAETRT